MALVDLLAAAAERDVTDAKGRRVRIELRPGLDDAAVSLLQARYPVPLPADLVAALRVTTGADALFDLDLTGESHLIEAAALLPAGHPVAADGQGNFWLLDLTPDTTESAPVFFLSHDPPVLLYQAPDLAAFIEASFERGATPERSLIDEVRADRTYDVWGTRPGARSRAAALSAGDQALREFAQRLDETWTIVDLRHREVGMGLAWGRYGPQTRLARHGWERIFAYAPYAARKRSWWRLGRVGAD